MCFIKNNTLIVEAENEVEAVEKVRTDENTYLGWDKWNTEECDSIIDFYPPLTNRKE